VSTPLSLLAALVADPTPAPSPSPLRQLSPDQVTPGFLGLASFLFLVVAVYFIWRSMNRQIKRIDFDESGADSDAGTTGGGDRTGPDDDPTPAPETNHRARS
jgi:hypothetical protein